MDELLVSAKQALQFRISEDLQVLLPALGLPSFVKLVCDGFTPQTGEPLDIEMLQTCSETGSVDSVLLNMPAARSISSAKKSHGYTTVEPGRALHFCSFVRSQVGVMKLQHCI